MSGRVGDCAKAGVVYQLECLTCHNCYIRQTGRNLGVRLKEHLASKRRGTPAAPLGRHKTEVHGGNDYEVKCTILTYETEICARKLFEAAWISIKNPELNVKNECLSISSDLAPFISLCELSDAHKRP